MSSDVDDAIERAKSASRRLWWWLTARRCGCRQMRLRGGTVELDGVKHRVGAPCFPCDTYGNPL